jgi:hypothetical protein
LCKLERWEGEIAGGILGRELKLLRGDGVARDLQLLLLRVSGKWKVTV